MQRILVLYTGLPLPPKIGGESQVSLNARTSCSYCRKKAILLKVQNLQKLENKSCQRIVIHMTMDGRLELTLH
jgi:hypothetical protein